MSIFPLPQFEADLAEDHRSALIDTLTGRGIDRGELEGLDTADLERLERRKAPTSLVVRFGVMKLIGEFPYSGDATPGCGSRLVVRTHRGTEMGELLTATCPNAGCSSSVTRQQMLDYIEVSGGRQYPFFNDGRVLRIATAEDMDTQSRLEQSRHGLKMQARAVVESLGLEMKIVDAEPILGGERLTFFYTSEDRVDFRELVRELGAMFRSRIDMRQVGARDEARLTADYEKCGQYCCCKNFLKVLRPVSMKSAKVQKATLDPVKISGRCGRLMCCLRYEDESYEALARRLPRRKAKVGTPDGDGFVVATQILTQLVLVRLDESGEEHAYPIEEIGAPGERPESSGPKREQPARRARPISDRPRREVSDREVSGREVAEEAPAEPTEEGPTRKKRRRRRRKRSGEAGEGIEMGAQAGPDGDGGPGNQRVEPGAGERSADPGEGVEAAGDGAGEPAPRKRRRKRRRHRGSTGGDGSSPEASPGEGGGPG